MQALLTIVSPWQQLKVGKISCTQALSLLVNEAGVVKLDLLDPEVSYRFFRQIFNCSDLPPVIPLLLCRNCYYLGSPATLTQEDIQKLSDHTLTNIKFIHTTEESYHAWYLTETFNLKGISDDDPIAPLPNPNQL
jgi:hypothetical protein